MFLHELGHLQVIDEQAKSQRLKFAREKYAEEFAMDWCKRLWSQSFGHPDPVHSPPSAAELEALGQLVEAVESGLKDSREGRTVPLEEARRRFGLEQP